MDTNQDYFVQKIIIIKKLIWTVFHLAQTRSRNPKSAQRRQYCKYKLFEMVKSVKLHERHVHRPAHDRGMTVIYCNYFSTPVCPPFQSHWKSWT